jgi:hypothetical protein
MIKWIVPLLLLGASQPALAPSYARAADGWQQLLGQADAEVPLYLRNPARDLGNTTGSL